MKRKNIFIIFVSLLIFFGIFYFKNTNSQTQKNNVINESKSKNENINKNITIIQDGDYYEVRKDGDVIYAGNDKALAEIIAENPDFDLSMPNFDN